MSTPTAWAAWKAEAMLLADLYQAAAFVYAIEVTKERAAKSSAARAALAAHLDEVPMGEPVATLVEEEGEEPDLWTGFDPRLCEPGQVMTPLYRHPKESA